MTDEHDRQQELRGAVIAKGLCEIWRFMNQRAFDVHATDGAAKSHYEHQSRAANDAVEPTPGEVPLRLLALLVQC